MLARDRRLRHDRDFSVVWRSRWVVRHPALTLRVAPRPASPGRVGFVVSKAVAKRAVDRNLLKRRLRAIMGHRKTPPGHDLAFIAGRPALTLTYLELSHVVDTLLHQALAGPRGRRTH